MHPSGKALLVLIASILLYAYGRAYFAVVPTVSISQTSIENPALSAEGLLREKVPIVLQESVISHDALVKSIFKYQVAWWTRRKLCDNRDPQNKRQPRIRCKARWTLVTGSVETLGPTEPEPNPEYGSESNELAVDLYHPDRRYNPLRVKLRQDQPLIIPPRWSFSCQMPDRTSGTPRTSRKYGTCYTITHLYDALHLALCWVP
jgi:hypothetical protein